MAITRIWQTGFELGSLTLEGMVNQGSNGVNAAIAKTGARAWSFNQLINAQTIYHQSDPVTQCQAGLHMRHQGTQGTEQPEIVTLRDTTTNVVRLCYSYSTNEFIVLCGTTEVARVDAGNFSQFNTWNHLGLDVKLHASAGWVYVWHDGNLVIEYDGKTDHGGSGANRLYFGNVTSNQNWDGLTAFDDIYWDDSAGEALPSRPADLRFPYISPSGNGSYSEWTGSDSDQTDNYLLVDEIPPNGDTDYVEGNEAGEQDSYAMTSYTLLEGESIRAVIPVAIAKKQDAETGLEIKNFTRLAATDQAGAAQVLGTDYRMHWERQTEKPGGGAWSQSDLDNVEVGVELA